MNRRKFLVGAMGAVAAATPAVAATDPTGPVLRGTLNAAELGLATEKAEDQSRVLQRLIETASKEDRQIFLPPGTYMISDLRLPPRVRLSGVAGATKLVFAGGDSMISAARAELVQLSGLTIDGAGLPMADYVGGLVASGRMQRRRDRGLRHHRQRRQRPGARPLGRAHQRARRSPVRRPPASAPSNRPACRSPTTSSRIAAMAASWSGGGRPARTAPSSAATGSSGSPPRPAAPARTATASTSSAPTA